MATHKRSANGHTQKVSKRTHTKGQQTRIEESSANDHTERVSKWPHTKGQQMATHKRSANGYTQKVNKRAYTKGQQTGQRPSGQWTERCLHYTAPQKVQKVVPRFQTCALLNYILQLKKKKCCCFLE